MSSAEYAVYLSDHTGLAFRRNITDMVISCDATRVTNNVGTCSLRMDTSKLDDSYFRRDARIAIYRTVPGRSPRLLFDTVYLLRHYTNEYNGMTKIRTLYGRDLNCILERRRIAYYAATAQAKKTSVALDDMIKEIVDEQIGATATDATRQLTNYITVDPYRGALAPVADKSMSWRPLLQVIQELAQTSIQNGTYLAFDLYALDETTFFFQTFINQRGYDRRQGSGNQFILSLFRGNFDNISLRRDWDDEITRAYVGAQGLYSDRNVQYQDSIQAGASIFGLIEDFSDVRHIGQTETARATDEAYARLREGRAKLVIEGDIQETEGSIYGVHYAWGDYITVNVDTIQADCRLDIARCRLARSNDTIEESFDISALIEDSDDL